jgi:hypothetical protein
VLFTFLLLFHSAGDQPQGLCLLGSIQRLQKLRDGSPKDEGEESRIWRELSELKMACDEMESCQGNVAEQREEERQE